jgi:acetyltransferase-like isoleucine patch superfamily enzyme
MMNQHKQGVTMHAFTEAEFEALPIVNGYRQCPAGDYSAIAAFGSKNVFEGGCVFAEQSVFSEWCDFGPNCTFGESCKFGYGCTFREESVFSDWCEFADGCVFGHDCVFSTGCLFREFSKFGEACVFGEKCTFKEECHFGKQCRFGNSSQFADWCEFAEQCSFSQWCWFGSSISFGDQCQFESQCKFGLDISFGHQCVFSGRVARPGNPLLIMSGVGDTSLTIYAFNVEGGPLFEFDRFSGGIDAFRAKVRKDADDFDRTQCLGFANIVASVWYPEKIETLTHARKTKHGVYLRGVDKHE